MLMRTDRRTLLRENPLFAAFDDAQFERVAAGVQCLELAVGQRLFEAGDPAHACFVVVDGAVKLSLHSRAGEEKIMEFLGPGSSFAEAIMFLQAPAYPVAATALEPSTVLAIPSAAYLAVLRDNPAGCFRLLGVLSQRLHARMREIEELTLASAGDRFIRFIVRHAQRQPDGRARLVLDQTRQALAAQLAIKPETLSRLVRQLVDAGELENHGRDLVVVDARRLEARLA